MFKNEQLNGKLVTGTTLILRVSVPDRFLKTKKIIKYKFQFRYRFE